MIKREDQGVRVLDHAYLKSLEGIGVNHVALNLRFNQADTKDTLQRLAEEILPEFSAPEFASPDHTE